MKQLITAVLGAFGLILSGCAVTPQQRVVYIPVSQDDPRLVAQDCSVGRRLPVLGGNYRGTSRRDRDRESYIDWRTSDRAHPFPGGNAGGGCHYVEDNRYQNGIAQTFN